MAWSTNPTGGTYTSPGWSTSVPPARTRLDNGWQPVIHELAAALGVSTAQAVLAVRAVAGALHVSGAEAVVLLRATAQARSASSALAAAREHHFTGAHAASSSRGSATATVAAVASALGTSAAAATSLVVLAARGTSLSAPAAAAAFPMMEPVDVEITTVGEFVVPIPFWCRYIDVVLLGGGGGGSGGDSGLLLNGRGGLAGGWYTATLERGVLVDPLLTELTGVVGAGGNGRGTNTAGNYGNPTILYVGDLVLTGAAGKGGPRPSIGTGNSGTPGQSPGTVTLNGREFVGGDVAYMEQDGNPPGGGGGYGRGGILGGGTAGRNGARGQVWLRFYQ
ncbi:minor tail protein [Mycobacterium phage LilPharaoh]|uniref:Minor tail protein n=1 Tax=Mycobacterium phage Amelie TaxID=1913035 RepID=A0A1J0GQ94_9CAUD|nr:minor tail protein [Mycobacterium phage Amelie]ATN90477.1 minor tail protein [Mycobacterium phage LilPharaoh]AVP42601.1 minor tail protein [Mycobacterium phage SgtBeansprout]AXC37130.1 minor tail protein [Mycobacterium phage Biglebops]QGJ93309.1 minor tail protein [Mycobacterium phage Mdavu]UQS94425.1 minor tail protein [Mycobacterium phage Nutello]UXE03186.1 minor tail protein [Mycobacterium phage Nikao]